MKVTSFNIFGNKVFGAPGHIPDLSTFVLRNKHATDKGVNPAGAPLKLTSARCSKKT